MSKSLRNEIRLHQQDKQVEPLKREIRTSRRNSHSSGGDVYRQFKHGSYFFTVSIFNTKNTKRAFMIINISNLNTSLHQFKQHNNFIFNTHKQTPNSSTLAS